MGIDRFQSTQRETGFRRFRPNNCLSLEFHATAAASLHWKRAINLSLEEHAAARSAFAQSEF